jgi:hypothetical protein
VRLPVSVYSEAIFKETKYSGPSNFEQFDVRTTWNSNKKFEENPGLKVEQKLGKSNKESRGRHVVAFSLCLVQMKEG